MYRCDVVVKASAKRFWQQLAEVERAMRSKFKHLPLVAKQGNTKPHQMSASTLQAAKCVYSRYMRN